MNARSKILGNCAVVLLSLVLSSPAGTASPLLNVAAPGALLPLVRTQMLQDGAVESGNGRGVYAVSVEVNPPPGCQGWEVFVRSRRPDFRSDGSMKPCSDLRWKLDTESASHYRAIRFEDELVAAGFGDNRTSILIDVAIDVDWETEPGHYYLDMVYGLVCR